MIFTPEWMTAVSTIVLVIATIIYVYFTYKLTKETTKLREVETTPFISIYTKPTRPIEMIVENIGKAPAYNIEIKFDEKYLDCFLFGCTKNKNKISYFSPNQQFTILLKQYGELEKSPHEYIPVSVTYQSKDGRTFEEVFNIEWKYLSSSEIEKDGLEEIKKELEKTVKTLDKIDKTMKGKELFITHKLKILEFEKNDDEISIVFSNGFLTKIKVIELDSILNTKNANELILTNGNLFSYEDRLTYLAEEVYAMLNDSNKS
jgi:hypothetical protein